jgi:hypothetical protein
MKRSVLNRGVVALVAAGLGAAVMLTACTASTPPANGVASGPGGVILFQPVQMPRIQFTAPRGDIVEQAVRKPAPQERPVVAPAQTGALAQEAKTEKAISPAQDAVKSYGGCGGKMYSGYAP